MIGCSFASDWLRDWCKFSSPITKWSNAKKNKQTNKQQQHQSWIIFNTQLKTVLTDLQSNNLNTIITKFESFFRNIYNNWNSLWCCIFEGWCKIAIKNYKRGFTESFLCSIIAWTVTVSPLMYIDYFEWIIFLQYTVTNYKNLCNNYTFCTMDCLHFKPCPFQIFLDQFKIKDIPPKTGITEEKWRERIWENAHLTWHFKDFCIGQQSFKLHQKHGGVTQLT